MGKSSKAIWIPVYCRNTKHIVISFGKLDQTNELTSLHIQVIKRLSSRELNLFAGKKRPQTNELISHKTTKLQLDHEISPHWPLNLSTSSNKFSWINNIGNVAYRQRVSSIVRDETLYLTMLSAVTPTQWVFYIISVLPHMHIFTDVSMFGCF